MLAIEGAHSEGVRHDGACCKGVRRDVCVVLPWLPEMRLAWWASALEPAASRSETSCSLGPCEARRARQQLEEVILPLFVPVGPEINDLG